MFGIIFLWKVKPGKLAEHDALMKRTLVVERERAPEVLLNLTLGPAADGTCAEVQVYHDYPSHESFVARAQKEDAELKKLWDTYGEIAEPDSWKTLKFESMDFLTGSFVRPVVPIGGRKLTGRVALVTGGARGIGAGIAAALTEAGATVAVTDLKVTHAQAALAIEADVTSEDSVRAMIAECVAKLGGLDILVNNAGIYPFKPVDQFSTDEFRRVLDVNLIAPWLLAKHALPHLKRTGHGAIVNIASCSGIYGGASPGGSAYDASKAALNQMTYSLAAEFGPQGVRVNAIAPGIVDSQGAGGFDAEVAATPLRRVGTPADIGHLAAFLASDDASFLNGITVIADGGRMAQW
jgi:3-oxoacyl-[acyl-carrier protein] reductase